MYTAYPYDQEGFHRTSGTSATTWTEITQINGAPSLFLEVGNYSGGTIQMRVATSTPTGTNGRTILDQTVKTFTGALPSEDASVWIYGAAAPDNVEFSWA